MVDMSGETSGSVDVIDTVGGLTPDWFTSALRASGHDVSVDGVQTTPVGTGQMGMSIRCELTYADGVSDGLPSSVVAKLPSADLTKRPMVASVYRSEVVFYREIAPTVAIARPGCLHAGISEDSERFVLLMDDLAPAVQGDQIAGCSVTEAQAAAVNLAGLHGPRWLDESLLAYETLALVGPDDAAFIGPLLEGATATFLANYEGRISEQDSETLNEVTKVIGPWLLARPERFGLLHGDYRLDNLMFGPGPLDVSTVDWQTLSIGLPGRDLAYFVGTSLDPEPRRNHESEIVASYHQALIGHGVRDYDLEQCFDDYRFGMLQGPLITIMGAAYGERTERGDEMFLTMSRRSCSAIRDLGTLELVRSETSA